MSIVIREGEVLVSLNPEAALILRTIFQNARCLTAVEAEELSASIQALSYLRLLTPGSENRIRKS